MTAKLENLDIAEQTNALRRELNGSSDRAAAIVAGAVLDSVLQELLLSALISDPKSDKELFDGSGALSTFSAKTKMAFRMGLISRDERRSLTLIREIRNLFAHQLSGVSFMLSPIKEKTRELEIPMKMARPPLNDEPAGSNSLFVLALTKADSNDLRAVFSEAVISLNLSLITRLMASINQNKEPPANFVAAHEPIELMVFTLRKLIASLEKRKKLFDEQLVELRSDFEKLCKLAPLGVDVIKETKVIHDSAVELERYTNFELPKLISDTRAKMHQHERWITEIKAAHAARLDFKK